MEAKSQQYSRVKNGKKTVKKVNNTNRSSASAVENKKK
jgi:hypothetical protein